MARCRKTASPPSSIPASWRHPSPLQLPRLPASPGRDLGVPEEEEGGDRGGSGLPAVGHRFPFSSLFKLLLQDISCSPHPAHRPTTDHRDALSSAHITPAGCVRVCVSVLNNNRSLAALTAARCVVSFACGARAEAFRRLIGCDIIIIFVLFWSWIREDRWT